MNNYYETKIIELLFTMSEEKKKALYDFITLLEEVKQEQGEKKNTHQTTQKEVYKQNDTMEMIGKQIIDRYIGNEEICKGIKDIVQARVYDIENIFEIAFDVFLYGCVIGKREERAKKKATAKPTTVKQ